MKNLIIFYFFAFILALSGCQGGGSSSSNTNDSTDTSDTTDTTDNNADDSTDNNTGDSTDTSDSTDTTAPVSPSVVSFTPAANSTDVAVDTTLSVAFNTELNAATVTTNSSTTECSGNVQLSADNFVTCAPLSVSTSDNKTFVFTPTEDLKHLHTYHVHITTNVATAEGETLQANYTSSEGFTTANINGVFDTAFSGNGKLDYQDETAEMQGFDIAYDSQGRIFIAGGDPESETSTLWCYTPLGELCSDFATDGVFQSSGFPFKHLVIDSSDNIYALKNSSASDSDDFDIVKLNSNGQLVNDFGTSGIQTITLIDGTESAGNFQAVIFNEDLIISGWQDDRSTSIPADGFIAKVSRLTGNLDTTFDSDGLVTLTSVGGQGYVQFHDILVDDAGSIYITGYSGGGSSGTTDQNMIIAKYTSEGALDTSFDSDGIVTNTRVLTTTQHEQGKSLVFDQNGNLIILGTARGDENYDQIAIWRYDPQTSALDTSFADNGATFIDTQWSDSSDHQYTLAGHDVHIDQANNILLSVNYFNDDISVNATIGLVFRLTPGGELDLSFADDGKLPIEDITDEKNLYVQAMELDTNGRVIATGSIAKTSGYIRMFAIRAK